MNKIVTTIFWRVDEKLIYLQAKRSLLPHVSALVNKKELFMMKTEQRQIVWMELYLAGGIRSGLKQLAKYKAAYESRYGHVWKTVLDLY